jgi:hypothetical protein
MLSFSYIYLINDSVINTVAREQNNKAIALISAEIGTMENSYISLRSDINIDLARSLGFDDNYSNVHFSSENGGVAGSLSLLGNEI